MNRASIAAGEASVSSIHRMIITNSLYE